MILVPGLSHTSAVLFSYALCGNTVVSVSIVVTLSKFGNVVPSSLTPEQTERKGLNCDKITRDIDSVSH
jgi:hypothetical protein